MGEERKTVFYPELACNECDWARHPNIGMRFPPIERRCCPVCGGSVSEYVGRWFFTGKGSMFSPYKYTRFERMRLADES